MAKVTELTEQEIINLEREGADIDKYVSGYLTFLAAKHAEEDRVAKIRAVDATQDPDFEAKYLAAQEKLAIIAAAAAIEGEG